MNSKVRDAVDKRIIDLNIELVVKASETFKQDTNWYSETLRWCRSIETDLTTQQVVGIFSAFSPLKSVEQCKKLTEDFIKGEEVKTIGSQISKAEAIFKESNQTEIAKILNGTKTVAFFHSILGCAHSSEIAIDVHMMKLAPSRWGSLTPKRYQMLCQQIQAACRGTYYSPQKYQAGLWGTLKNMSCIEEI